MSEHQPVRFNGTMQQISSALKFYRIMAIVTGVMLVLLCVEMLLKYLFNAYVYFGGVQVATGEPFSGWLVMAEPESVFPLQHLLGNLPDVTQGFNLSVAVLIVHGWCYVLYLLADFRLYSLLRWPFSRFVLVALGGVVPLLSFFMERKVSKEVSELIAQNPQAASRY